MRCAWLAGLIVVVVSCRGQEPTPGQVARTAAPAAPVAAAPSTAWSEQVARSLAEEQRQPQPIAGGFALSADALHARFDASGIEVRASEEGARAWRFDLDRGPHFDAAEPEINGSRVIYRRGGGVTEWYEGRPEGIEQGFTIEELPPHGGDLIVRGHVESDEPGRVIDDGLAFGELRYTGLAVWDAAGRPLHAAIEWDAATAVLALRVPADQLVGAELPIVIDPLLSTPAWTAESDQESAIFGQSVASAGDVNGDGYDDVVVGAHAYDNGEVDEGRAFLYLGSMAGLSATAVWTAESDQASAYFGASVASAGDVNGDGYGDVVVGAVGYDNGQTQEGRAFLYLGSAAGLSVTAAWTAEPDLANANFGHSVASAGDVNGDGYGDVVVGAPYYTNGELAEGRAYVYLGSAAGLSATAAWTAESDQVDAAFGRSVASAGDVNGDGYGDVVVGALVYDNGQTDEGRAYLYLGSVTGLAATAVWTAEADQVTAYFGFSVASAGDVNGDGYGDVVVGAWQYDNGETNEGRAYLYLGSAAGLSATAAWTAESDQIEALFGHSVASAGDVNGDGYGDVVVGAYVYDNVETNEGRAYLYQGSATGLSVTAAWTAESDQYEAQFGNSVASAGDVNGDGYGDVVVGAYTYDNGQSDEGRVFLYLGGDCGDGIVTAGEACDDGNVVSGDGCDSDCTFTTCGNGITTVGETCDDGNVIDDDGCDSNCTLTGCGNGILTLGEACDDANATDGDGCDSNCTLTACRNGIATAGEACDDGNINDGDGCDSNCTPTACGNGVVTSGEACDDGNTVDGDGCESDCSLIMPAGCGNGILDTGEICDDGNTAGGDGCSAACDSDETCGNATLDAGEACDDGNGTAGDGCENDCAVTPGAGTCGDGTVSAGEVCDDGNTTAGDGCSPTCLIEEGDDSSGCGCVVATRDAQRGRAGPLLLGLVVAAFVWARRRPR